MAEQAPNKFLEAKIYAIRNWVNQEVYVGSTCQSLADRFRMHKSGARCRPVGQLHHLIREVGFDAFSIELLEACPCNSRLELLSKEREWVERIGTLNTKTPARSKKEQNRAYYQFLLENRPQYHRDRHISVLCACGGRCSENSRPKHERTVKHQNYLASLPVLVVELDQMD